MYEKSNCEDQNKVLMTYMVPFRPPRETSQKTNPRKRTTIQYLVRKTNGDCVNVCAQTFSSIVTMGKLINLRVRKLLFSVIQATKFRFCLQCSQIENV